MVENKPPVNRYTCQQRGGYCPEQSWRWPFCEFSFPFITVQLGSDFAIPMNSIELSVNSPQQMHHNEEQVKSTDFVLTSGYIQPLFRGRMKPSQYLLLLLSLLWTEGEWTKKPFIVAILIVSHLVTD